MNKLKIRLSTPEMVADFINVCSSLKYKNFDINVYDGRSIIDAKSIVGVLQLHKEKK